jgi:nitrogen fixation NifU-like protein
MEHSNTFYNEIVTDHNLHPGHKQAIEGANYELEGVNPSCGDDIVLQLKVEDGKIVGRRFCRRRMRDIAGLSGYDAGSGHRKDSVEEAKHLSDIFLRMIKGNITDEERDELEEAGVLQDISHMPARVKCAVLGWHTMDEIIDYPDKAEKKPGQGSGFTQMKP